MTSIVLALALAGPVPTALSTYEVKGAQRLEVWWGAWAQEEPLDLGRRGLRRELGMGLPRMERGAPFDFSTGAADLAPAPGIQNLASELVGLSRGGVPGEFPPPPLDPWRILATSSHIAPLPDPGARIEGFPWPWRIEGGLGEQAAHLRQRGIARKAVILYALWKETALSGRKNVYYYAYAGMERGQPVFTRNGGRETRTVQGWLNLELRRRDGGSQSSAGLHFFDTANGENPQHYRLPPGEKPRGVLTPPVLIDPRRSPAGAFQAAGFIYLNAEEVRFRGMGRPEGSLRPVHPPGEPYLDEGIDLDGDGHVCDDDDCCPADPQTPRERTRCNERETVANGAWDVELDPACDPDTLVCSPDIGNLRDPRWQDFITAHTVPSGHLPHPGRDPRLLDTFPHEPYLNLDYPDAQPPWTARVDYSAGREGQRGPDRGRRRSAGEPSSPGYDRLGPRIWMPVHLQGVLASEGPVVLGRGTTIYGAVVAPEVRARGRCTILADGQLRREWITRPRFLASPRPPR